MAEPAVEAKVKTERAAGKSFSRKSFAANRFEGIELQHAQRLSNGGKATRTDGYLGNISAVTEVSKSEADKMTAADLSPSLSAEMPKRGFDREENNAAREVTAAEAAAESPIEERAAAEWLKRARLTAFAISRAAAAQRV